MACKNGKPVNVKEDPNSEVSRKRSYPTNDEQKDVLSDPCQIYSGTASTPKINQGEPERQMLAINSSDAVKHGECNINMIQLGRLRMKPWYFSPYPKQLCGLKCLYICEFCLRPFGSSWSFGRHESCELNRPPGYQIYDDGSISFFEVDGRRNTAYAEHLSLLSKLFLDHKTVRLDTSPFVFYVMTESRGTDCQIVGYFSKEKRPPHDYNLSCILVLPAFQRKGYGRFLIDFSYELTKMQGKKGTPEGPLSYFGRVAYENYWYEKIVEHFLEAIEENSGSSQNSDIRQIDLISVQQISDRTGIKKEDILSTMKLKGIRTEQQKKEVFYLSEEAIDLFKKAREKRRLEFSNNSLKVSSRYLQSLYE